MEYLVNEFHAKEEENKLILLKSTMSRNSTYLKG